jgi:RNA polymerase-interacting CarD/CdnL/TRCF family regulator
VVKQGGVKGHNPRPEEAGSAEGLITEAAVLKAGDRVVYPNQGVCRVTGTEVKEIAGQRLELVRMEREEDGAAVMVPRNKVASIGLRRVATPDYVEGVFHYLAAQYDDPELDWKIRHRDNADRLITGGVLGIAEVVKGLHSLSRIRPLPTKEREQYDNARHLLVAEVSAALGVPPSLAEDYVDYALMPPAGIKFQLRPPPKPVELPVRLSRRKPIAKAEDDLGLDDLGLELGELPELGEAAEGGEEKAEGEAAGAEGEGTEEAAAEAAPAAKPARAEKKPRAAAKKAAPRRAEKAKPQKRAGSGKAAHRKPEKKARGGKK